MATIPAFAAYAGARDGGIAVSVLAALLITLIPTTIAALLSAIGIAGMDRLVRFNVLAKSGRAVEAELRLEDLASGFLIGNALRGLIPAVLA